MNRIKTVFLFAVLFLIILCSFYAKKRCYDPHLRIKNADREIKELTDKNKIHNGDLIFQTSLSAQSKAIQLATHSEYSHCGIIFKDSSGYFVFEAIQPVKSTPLNKWIARGLDGHYVIKRLKNAEQILTPEIQKKMKVIAERFRGKNYDIYFEWSDERIYCSELTWKIYKEATGLAIGKLEKLKDFDLSSDAVKQKMKERYGDNIPADEPVISPVSIFNSDLLIAVEAK